MGDTFGRIKGKYCITASNIAKYDFLHSLVIFDEHNPFLFNRKRIADYLSTAVRWFKAANSAYKKAVYPFLMWNSLWRAGASIEHGHLQLTLSPSCYPKIEFLRTLTEKYKKRYSRDYWQDLFSVHSALGLATKYKKAKVIAYLTPIKEKEIIVLINKVIDAVPVINALLTYYSKIGVDSFNLVFLLPPLTKEVEWDMPIIARILDRGRLSNKIADIGAMELYACSVVSNDPFKLMEGLKKQLC